eukprot:2427577-Alexandrium_andersonii.AAC.1
MSSSPRWTTGSAGARRSRCGWCYLAAASGSSTAGPSRGTPRAVSRALRSWRGSARGRQLPSNARSACSRARAPRTG